MMMLAQRWNCARRWAARRVDALKGRKAALAAIVVVVCGSLAFVLGTGVSSLTVRPRAGHAWLGTRPTGDLTLVDAATGRVSAQVSLAGSAGHTLQVRQSGDSTLVYDPASGALSRIDPVRLTVGASRPTVPGVEVVGGPTAAYVVNSRAGTVQALDVTTLQTQGPVMRLAAPLGEPSMDGQGTLWVPSISTGAIVPITGSTVGVPVKVGQPGDGLQVVMAGGQPLTLDSTSGRVSALSSTGVTWSVSLGSGHPGVPSSLVASPTAPGDVVAVLDQTDRSVHLVNVSGQKVTTVALPRDVNATQLGVPAVDGGHLYLPDFSTGGVKVFGLSASNWLPAFQVRAGSGPFDTVVNDGNVYFNDPGTTRAVVIGPDGSPLPVDKSEPGVASQGPSVPTPTSPAQQASPPLTDRSRASFPAPPATTPPMVGATSAPPATAPTFGWSPPTTGAVAASPLPPAPTPPGPTTSIDSTTGGPTTTTPITSTSAPTSTTSPTTSTTTSPTTSTSGPTSTTVTVANPPLAPQNVTATSQAGAVLVAWTAPGGGGPVDHFVVSAQPGGEQVQAPARARQALVTLSGCQTDHFTVTAVGVSGQLVASASSAPARSCVIPDPVVNLHANSGSAGDVTLSWSAPANGATQYKIHVAGQPNAPGDATVTQTQVTFAPGALVYLARYTFSVVATNPAGSSTTASVSGQVGPAGLSFKVDVSLTKTDPQNPCVNPISSCRAAMMSQAGFNPSSQRRGLAFQGTTVTGFCHRSGETTRNDLGQSTTQWIVVDNGSARGFVSTLWLGGPNAYQSLSACPGGYTP